MAGAVHLFRVHGHRTRLIGRLILFVFIKDTFPYSAKNKALKAIYKYVVSSAAINKCDWCKV